MDSRLLTTLSAQATNTQDPVVWAKAVCRAASHFAGHGRTSEALAAIGVVRAQFGKDLHFDVASWLMLAEGVLHYFQVQLPESSDRITRAYALAIVLKNKSAFPSCAAWMAHREFSEGRFSDMVTHLEEAFTRAEPDDHQAIARASLTLAVAYHIAGNFQLARPWYEKARLNAAAEGDDATISATLHNMASLRAAEVRLADTFGEDISKETIRVSMEAISSYSYDYAIGHRGIDFLTQMLNGLIFTIQRKSDAALNLFDAIDLKLVPPRLTPLVLVDQAWCHVIEGDYSTAWSLAETAISQIGQTSLDDDDLAYSFSRLGQISETCGKTMLALEFNARAQTSLKNHREYQRNLLELLDVLRIKLESKNPA